MTQFEKDIASPHRALFAQAREFLITANLRETKKPRITTYSDEFGGICHVRTMAHGIDFGFLKGAFFDDAPARLHGVGKRLRVLSLREFEPDVVNYYLQQAITANRGK